MGLFPLPRRVRSYMGPHMTCVQSAETYAKRYSHRANAPTFELFLHRSIVFSHLQFEIYFSLGIFTIAAFLVMMMVFFCGYGLMHIFLRFQYKLTIVLIMLGRRRISFDDVNKLFIFVLHMLMLFIGGFGWIFMLFIET